MQDSDRHVFNKAMVRMFTLYGGRATHQRHLDAYWEHLKNRVTLQSLVKGLDAACDESPDWPPTAMNIAKHAGYNSVSKASRELLESGKRLKLQSVNDSMFTEEQQKKNVVAIRNITSMLEGKLG